MCSLPCNTLRGGGGGKRERYILFRAGKFCGFVGACVRANPVLDRELS